jgi:hypothetical protein
MVVICLLMVEIARRGLYRRYRASDKTRNAKGSVARFAGM